MNMKKSNMTQITDNLWVSDISTVRHNDTSRFDRVVSVCQDNVNDHVDCPNPHFNLADGKRVLKSRRGECSYRVFAPAAEEVADALRNQETVLVHCQAGISRSVSTAIAALTAVEGGDFDEWERKVTDQRPGSPGDRLLGYAEAFAHLNQY